MRFVGLSLGLLVASGCAAAPPEPAHAPPSPVPAPVAVAPPAPLTPPPTETAALEPVDVTFTSGVNQLRGVVVKPPGAGPFPALVWSHGSEENPKLPRKMAQFFVSQGYVVFNPFRRGHPPSPGRWVIAESQALGGEAGQKFVVAELERQVDDVSAAVVYVRAQSFVDPHKIVLAGCSFGGITTLLAAERATGARAAVDFAGGAMSWRSNEFLQDRMKLAARRTQIPVFYIQAENDFSTLPTEILSAEAQKSNRPHLTKIYPPNGTEAADGHHLCVARPDVWGADVTSFLRAQTQ